MKIGIFDHLDRSDVKLTQFYEERLQLIETADALGIDSYHLAEHHWNPVGMAPLPGVFLGAAAARTKRIRLGPLAYALAFLTEPVLEAEHFRLEPATGDGELDHLPLGGRLLDTVERVAIKQTLVKAQGNKLRAARMLGIASSTLYKKMKKYSL